MAMHRVKFGQQLIQHYINVCRDIFRSKLEWLYTPRESFPATPESWRTAIKDKALNGYKLDLGSLKSNLLNGDAVECCKGGRSYLIVFRSRWG